MRRGFGPAGFFGGDKMSGVPQPIPTQLEADAFKTSAHGADPPGTPETGPPVNVTAPFISGTGAVGQQLLTTLGTWTGEPTEYRGAWFSDGTTHVGDGASYDIQPNDPGHAITCIVSATNSFGTTDSPPSNPILVV
jgi:hypothetical protein